MAQRHYAGNDEAMSRAEINTSLSKDRAAPRIKRAGRPARTDRPPYDLESLLDAAVRVFNRRGYDGSSMEDIARETGLSKSSIYHHVASKEELLARALERAFKPLLTMLDEVHASEDPPLRRLRRVVDRAVQITLEHAHEVELLQRIKGNTGTERDALKRRQRVDESVTALIRKAIAVGELRSDIAPDLLARLIFGMSNSITQWYRPRGKLTASVIAEAVSAIIFEGLAKP